MFSNHKSSFQVTNQVQNQFVFKSRTPNSLVTDPLSWLPALPPPSHPVGMLVVLTTPVKNYLKWRAIQLAIHSTVGT